MTLKSFIYPKSYNTRWVEVFGPTNSVSTTEVGGDVRYAPNSRSWNSIPDWKARISKGQDATTPFSGAKYSVLGTDVMDITTITPDGGGSYKSVIKGDNPRGSPISFGDSNGFDTASASNQALENFWKKLRKTQVTMSGQVFLGEIREAIHMIKNPASSLFNSHSGYLSKAQSLRRKHGKGKTGKAALADLWLEYKFGWAPMISDIEDGVKAYQKVFEPKGQTKIRAVGSSRDVLYPVDGNLAQIGHNGAPIRTTIRDTKECMVIYRAGLKDDRVTDAKANAAFNSRALKQFGLTVEEFIPTVWELTPWSFLIDYFTNIGDILEAVATSTSSVAWVNRTVRKENLREAIFKIDQATFKSWYPFGGSCSGSPGGYRTLSLFVDRSVLSSVPYPSFSMSIPTSPTKWANMLALLYSREKQERKFFSR